MTISPLKVTYDQVQADPWICRNNPLGKRPDVFGNLVLWEGKQNPNDKNSAIYRVLLARLGILRFERFDKRTNEWVGVQELPKRRFFRRKADRPAPGVVRIELFDRPSRTVRTVG